MTTDVTFVVNGCCCFVSKPVTAFYQKPLLANESTAWKPFTRNANDTFSEFCGLTVLTTWKLKRVGLSPLLVRVAGLAMRPKNTLCVSSDDQVQTWSSDDTHNVFFGCIARLSNDIRHSSVVVKVRGQGQEQYLRLKDKDKDLWSEDKDMDLNKDL